MENESNNEPNKKADYYREYRKKKPHIVFRLNTFDEKEQLKKRADTLGISLNQYIYSLIFDEKYLNKIKPKTDLKMIAEIRKIGININQISKAVNTTYGHLNLSELEKKLEGYLKELQKAIDKI